MFLSLNGFESQVMMDILQVRDTPDKKYSTLCAVLAGRGCYNLDEEWEEIRLKELYQALSEFIDDKFIENVEKLLKTLTVGFIVFLLLFLNINSKATFHLPLFKKLSATTSFLYK